MQRPDRVQQTPLPPTPDVGTGDPTASTVLARHRTGLSTHRTGLAEHRTSLSEYRSDLSTHRTNLATRRTEMAMRRTGMSLQRTRMSADRTLMSVIRTSLSLIGFGFTIAQVFQKLVAAGQVADASAPRYFGLALVLLGVGMLAFGVIYHLSFMAGLRRRRASMKATDLVHAESHFPVSLTVIVALLLCLIGLFAAWVVLQ